MNDSSPVAATDPPITSTLCGSQLRGSWEFPLTLVRNDIPLVIVPVAVNDSRPLVFVLDTGNATAGFVLSRRTADSLKLDCSATSEFGHANVVGPRVVELLSANVRSIFVGPFHFNHHRVAVSDAIDRLGAAIGKRIDGNIGYPFLRDLRLTLDYPRRVVRFEAATTMGVKGVSFELGSPKPLVLLSAMVNGAGPFRFALDTGAGSVVVSAELSRRLNLQQRQSMALQGAGGATAGFVTQLSRFDFAGVTLRDVTAVAGDLFRPLRDPVGGELDGIIGYNVMKDFTVTIDYPRQRLAFDR